MPRGGQNRLPAEVKKQRGTLQKCRTNVAAPSTKLKPVPPPPGELTDFQRAMWLELRPQVDLLGIYSDANASAFRMLVEVMSAWRNPEPDVPMHMRMKILTTASAMLSKFGLDPASRDRVSSLRGKDDGAGDEVPMFGIRGVVEGGEGA